MSYSPPKRVATVGGGISGISCLWGLRSAESIEVHLYEADDRLGGHANSVPIQSEDGQAIYSVDTGFVTMSEQMYPKFDAFLKALGVHTIETDMSFAVVEEGGSIEWGSTSFAGFYGSLPRLFTFWFWRLVFDIIRFNLFATDILSEKVLEELRTRENEKSGLQKRRLESIGEYLDRKRYSQQFKHYYLLPMVAAPWCMSLTDVANGFPAEALIYFMYRYRMLNTMTGTLRWKAFKNGSKMYLDKFVETTPQHHYYHLSTRIQRVVRQQGTEKALLVFTDGSVESFDHVVLAVHAHQALEILGEQSTSLEREVLGAFRTSRNKCVVHSDPTFFPKSPKAHASWTCLIRKNRTFDNSKLDRKLGTQDCFLAKKTGDDNFKTDGGPASVLFDMNRLQKIPGPGQSSSPGRILISMNPIRAPQSIHSRYLYYHPILDSASIQASRDLNALNRSSPNISFAGAWMGYGFHEDGFAAGLEVSHKLQKGEYESQSSVCYGTDLAKWIPHLSTGEVLARRFIEAVQLVIEWAE